MVVIADSYLPLTLSAPSLSDDQFQRLCEEYDGYRIEYYGPEEHVLLMPPTDDVTSFSNLWIGAQLLNWWCKTRRGLPTDSSGGFHLPDGSRLSPDAAWISDDRRGRRPTCPEFVIELLSPTDRRNTAHRKMQRWIDNGCVLGWLIDKRARSVTVYRPGHDPETLTGIAAIRGEGPVDGFVLDLEPVWD